LALPDIEPFLQHAAGYPILELAAA